MTPPTLQVLVELRVQFYEMLDRVEAAQRGDPQRYGPLENAADVELTKRFVHWWWDRLSHREQVAVQARLDFIRNLRKDVR